MGKMLYILGVKLHKPSHKRLFNTIKYVHEILPTGYYVHYGLRCF